MRPIVALLTDFGVVDTYVGAVKGAVLAACPEATLVDLSHEVPAFDVSAAAFALSSAYRSFPGGTVFLAVVDPGVGGARRAIAVEAGGYRFVGPDNGIFGEILRGHPDAQVRSVTNAGLFRRSVSATFHARDVFAPVAGRLAAGMPLDEVGSLIEDPTIPAVPDVVWNARGCEAVVIHVDRFGNLVTNFSEASLATLTADGTEVVLVVTGVVLPLVQTYSDVLTGEPCALVGGGGLVEVAINQGNACELFGVEKGARVTVRRV